MPDLTESLIVPIPLGRDFKLGVIPHTNPAIIVAARDLPMAEHLGHLFDRNLQAPEDYLHTRTNAVQRARFDLPFVPAPKTVHGWHPYLRISEAAYERDAIDPRLTSLTVVDGTPVFFAARPLYLTRLKIEATTHQVAHLIAAA